MLDKFGSFKKYQKMAKDHFGTQDHGSRNPKEISNFWPGFKTWIKEKAGSWVKWATDGREMALIDEAPLSSKSPHEVGHGL